MSACPGLECRNSESSIYVHVSQCCHGVTKQPFANRVVQFPKTWEVSSGALCCMHRVCFTMLEVVRLDMNT